MTLLLLLLHPGCFVETQSIRGTCTLELTLESADASPGEQIVLHTTPQTAPYDTVVFLDTLRLVPDDIEEGVSCDACQDQSDVPPDAFDCELDCEQDACDACSTCRDESYCSPCDLCLPCRDVCALCDERAYVTLPDTLSPGEVDVLLTNKFGTTNAVQLNILPAEEPNDSAADSGTLTDSSPPTDSEFTGDSGAADTGLSTQTTTMRQPSGLLQTPEEDATSSVRP